MRVCLNNHDIYSCEAPAESDSPPLTYYKPLVPLFQSHLEPPSSDHFSHSNSPSRPLVVNTPKVTRREINAANTCAIEFL